MMSLFEYKEILRLLEDGIDVKGVLHILEPNWEPIWCIDRIHIL